MKDLKQQAIQHLKDAGKFSGNPMASEMANNMAEFAEIELEKFIEHIFTEGYIDDLSCGSLTDNLQDYLSRDK